VAAVMLAEKGNLSASPQWCFHQFQNDLPKMCIQRNVGHSTSHISGLILATRVVLQDRRFVCILSGSNSQISILNPRKDYASEGALGRRDGD
jgi:hypothetical protein